MWDFLLGLVRVNEEINYSLIISVILGYLFLIWFIICVWIYFDARKRYTSSFISLLLAFFSLVFGPPALIFYIMVRPEHTLEEDYYMNLAFSGEKQTKPIYFEGDKGFDITINLSVEPKKLSENKHKMDMKVEWYPKDEQEQYELQKKTPSKKEKGILKKLQKSWNSLLTSTKSLFEKEEKDERKEKSTDEKKEKKDPNEDRQEDKKKQKKKKKKKKNKNKNKNKEKT